MQIRLRIPAAAELLPELQDGGEEEEETSLKTHHEYADLRAQNLPQVQGLGTTSSRCAAAASERQRRRQLWLQTDFKRKTGAMLLTWDWCDEQERQAAPPRLTGGSGGP